MSERGKVFSEASKAIEEDNACGFKDAVDQVSDVKARAALINDLFRIFPAPGYQIESSSSKSMFGFGKDSSLETKISGPNGLFYELNAKAGAAGQLEIVDEKPLDCKKK